MKFLSALAVVTLLIAPCAASAQQISPNPNPGGMGDGGGVALFTNAVPEPTTVRIWSMLAGLGMTVRRRR